LTIYVDFYRTAPLWSYPFYVDPKLSGSPAIGKQIVALLNSFRSKNQDFWGLLKALEGIEKSNVRHQFETTKIRIAYAFAIPEKPAPSGVDEDALNSGNPFHH
jgi:hypothetical protein